MDGWNVCIEGRFGRFRSKEVGEQASHFVIWMMMDGGE